MRVAVELFSGSGHFSHALRKHGWLVHEVDVARGYSHDLSTVSGQRMAWSLLVQADWIHIGLPCETYSSAPVAAHRLRSREFPMGRQDLAPAKKEQVDLHNILLRFTIRVIRMARRHSIPLSLENPSSSCLWTNPLMRKELVDSRRVTMDYCSFGTKFRKRTCFAVWGSRALDSLNCNRCHLVGGKCSFSGKAHFTLQGTAPGGTAWTKIAEPYPKAMCRKIARLIEDERDSKDFCSFRKGFS